MNYKDINDYEMLYLVEDQNESAYYYMYDKYRPLINKYATKLYNKYKCFGVEYDDLFQEGMFGLGEAIRQYNSNQSSIFYTLALICIKREMQRLIIKHGRYKNMILTNAISLDLEITDDNFSLNDMLYDETDLIENNYIKNCEKKHILDLKFFLKDKYALVYELKLNGFSNKDISVLLDIKYKDVDNYLRSIKLKLKRFKIDIEY